MISSRYPCAKCGQGEVRVRDAMCRQCQMRTKDLRKQKISEESKRCFYCGKRANVIDHLIPLIRGGDNRKDNRVSACQPCNSSKSDLLPSEWCPKNRNAMAREHRLRKSMAVYARVRGDRQIGGWSFEQHEEAGALLERITDEAQSLWSAMTHSFPSNGPELKASMRVFRRLSQLSCQLERHWRKQATLRGIDLRDSPYERKARKD